MMMKEVFLLALVVWMAISVLAWEPLEHQVSKDIDTSDKLARTQPQNTKQQTDDGEDTAEILGRSSSQTKQRHIRALTNYIIHGDSYWNPTDPELLRQLRVRPNDVSPRKGRFKNTLIAVQKGIRKCKDTAKMVVKAGMKLLKSPRNEDCEPTDENNQNENEPYDTVDTETRPFGVEDFSTSYAFPSLLIDTALGYYKHNCPNLVPIVDMKMVDNSSVAAVVVSGLHDIATEGKPSLYITEKVAIFKVSLRLPLKLEMKFRGFTYIKVPITHIASFSIKLQLHQDPVITLNEFKWDVPKFDYDTDEEITARSGLKLINWAAKMENILDKKINNILTGITKMIQMYAGYQPFVALPNDGSAVC